MTDEAHTAEMCLLGAMVLSPEAIDDARSVCAPESFLLAAHQTVARAVFRLADKCVAVDLVTLRSELEQMGELANVGGTEYLLSLVETCPSASNAPYYATIVQEAAVRRSVIAKAHRVLRMAGEDLSSSDLAFEAARMFESVTENVPIGDAVVQDITKVGLGQQNLGVSTGLPTIDRATTCRGLPCGQVTIIRADTGVGKTPLMTQLAYDAWAKGGRVAYALFADLTPEQFKARLAKLLSGRTSPPRNAEQRDVFGGQTEEDKWRETISEISDPYADGRFAVWNGFGGQSRNIETFKAWVTAENRRSPFTAVFIDYLQTARTSNPKATLPYERVTQVGAVITEMAFSMQSCATVVGSQVTQRDGGKTVARYGTESENDCGLQIEIVRERGARDCQLRVVKNRFGDVGTFDGFVFDTTRLRFLDPRGDEAGG